MTGPPNNDYINILGAPFQGQPNSLNNPNLHVLCGDNPPTVTAGYGIWSVIPRPLFQGITVPQGFEPARMKVELRFGIWDGRYGKKGWDGSPGAAMEVEREISVLHWMAGGGQTTGPSPAISISSSSKIDGQETPTYLVPYDYWNTTWVIDGGIDWSGKSIREQTTGGRIWQDASFTALAYLSIGVSPPKLPTSESGGYFKVTSQINTIYGIAASPSSNSIDPASLAADIAKAPQNNPCTGTSLKLERKSTTTYKLHVGLNVWVPPHNR